MSSTELVEYETLEVASTEIITAQSPKEFVARATELAEALTDVLKQQKMFHVIQGRKHVTVEGWTTLGSMLGATGHGVYAVPVGEPEQFVDAEGTMGWKATMKAVTTDGRVIGGATGYCMSNEKRWRNADIYAMAGMAQTRATSRCLRQALGWVVKIAGFEATPSEEMEGPAAKEVRAKQKTELPPEKLERFLTLQSQLIEQGDTRWEMTNVLETATRAFGREILKLDDLDEKELAQIITGAEAALVPFGDEDVNEEPAEEEKTDDDAAA